MVTEGENVVFFPKQCFALSANGLALKGTVHSKIPIKPSPGLPRVCLRPTLIPKKEKKKERYPPHSSRYFQLWDVPELHALFDLTRYFGLNVRVADCHGLC